MDEARERVDRRLGVLVGDAGHGRARLDDVALVCPGTDVRGPELEDELNRCRAELVMGLARGDDLGELVNGLLFRTFWLGFECGRAAE
jgi:hypothetical protein